jgi:hypothetical protein
MTYEIKHAKKLMKTYKRRILSSFSTRHSKEEKKSGQKHKAASHSGKAVSASLQSQ